MRKSLLLFITDLEAVDVEVEAEGLDDHGRSLPQRLPTAGAQLLPTDRPAGGRTDTQTFNTGRETRSFP